MSSIPYQTALGTNPWAFAAPASNGDSFVLDMATTAVAQGKVGMYVCMYVCMCVCMYGMCV